MRNWGEFYLLAVFHDFLSPPLFPLFHRAIYERLAGAVPEEQRAVYLQRVDDISPNIRYCAYNIGDMPTDVNQLMAMRNVSDMLASKINVSGVGRGRGKDGRRGGRQWRREGEVRGFLLLSSPSSSSLYL